jgi:Ca2+-binding RTX toxin-like protein
MASIHVANATSLQAALNTAKAGDTISLAAGNYGDFRIKNMSFASDIKVVAADANKPPVFNTIDVITSKGIRFESIVIDMKPTEATIPSTAALEIRGSSSITFSGGRIEGGDAVSGVSKTALVLDKTENVIGMPTGQGVLVFESNSILIENAKISELAKGVVIAKSKDVVVANNEIYDLRTSHIISAGTDNLSITGNRLSDSNPFRWGSGDHGDFIHLFTIKGGKQSENIDIKNNTLDQGGGTAILGIYLDDNGYGVGFKNVNINNNLIVNGNSQGITLENVSQSKVTNNVMVKADASQDKAPGVFVRGSTDVLVSGNYGSFVNVDGKSGGISTTGNFSIQTGDVHKSGYYQASDIIKVDAMSPNAALEYISNVFNSWTATDFGTKTVDKTMNFALSTSDVGMKVTAQTNASTIVTGGAGDDTLTGRQGNDTIVGGAGKDLLNGSGGNDVLIGGGGGDTFNFASDYPRTGGMDVIADFTRVEGDIIRLHSIDANTTNAHGTNDVFRFIGEQAFSKRAGELKVDYRNGDAFVSGDVNGDGVADFLIRMVGAKNLTAADFIL